MSEGVGVVGEGMMFHSTFRRVGDRRDFSPAVWRASFRSTARARWDHDLGGSISRRDRDGVRRSLVPEYLDGRVSIAYDDAEKYWIAVSSGGVTSGFMMTGNGATVPADSMIDLESAWPTVEQFLRAPEQRPAAIWVDAETLEWPDDY